MVTRKVRLIISLVSVLVSNRTTVTPTLLQCGWGKERKKKWWNDYIYPYYTKTTKSAQKGNTIWEPIWVPNGPKVTPMDIDNSFFYQPALSVLKKKKKTPLCEFWFMKLIKTILLGSFISFTFFFFTKLLY